MTKKIMLVVLSLVLLGAVSVAIFQVSQARGEEVGTPVSLDQGTVEEAQGLRVENAVAGSVPDQQSLEEVFGMENQATLGALPNVGQTGDLSEAERAALAYMREEEKLAHDVYLTLYEMWGLATFQNIANSEQAHMDAVKTLMDRYGVADPATGVVGEFTNADLQSLYNTLIERGSRSLAEAIKVGGAIEEIDILDLQERLLEVDHGDIQQVFNNLLRGSTSHLKAFVRVLQIQTGEIYQPQYMTQEAYQDILSQATGGYGQGGQGQGGLGRSAGGQGTIGGGNRGGQP